MPPFEVGRRGGIGGRLSGGLVHERWAAILDFLSVLYDYICILEPSGNEQKTFRVVQKMRKLPGVYGEIIVRPFLWHGAEHMLSACEA